MADAIIAMAHGCRILRMRIGVFPSAIRVTPVQGNNNRLRRVIRRTSAAVLNHPKQPNPETELKQPCGRADVFENIYYISLNSQVNIVSRSTPSQRSNTT